MDGNDRELGVRWRKRGASDDGRGCPRSALEVITGIIRNRLHGIEMFSNEIRMVPLEPVELPEPCSHQRLPDSETTT